MNNLNQIALEFLGRLEKEEATLLSWGLVDGSFSYPELEDKASAFLAEYGLYDKFESAAHFLELLLSQRLVFGFEESGESRFRTRMAETIRLLARLRQLFPRHMEGGQWRAAPTLTTDYRFILRPRAYPKRYLTPEAVMTGVDHAVSLDSLQKEVMEGLLKGPSSDHLNFADFQLLATQKILHDLALKAPRGTIICAGTGSGKTLAFYLPTLVHLVGGLDTGRWTRCLAIYPRNELLKDQLSETFSLARLLDSVLRRNRKRKIAIGALYSSTPLNGLSIATYSNWPKATGGFVCPYFSCPKPSCDGDLIWRHDDIKKSRERLHCSRAGCGFIVESDEIVLTRQKLQQEPPDILFTTTEMLNQRLNDSYMQHLFGVGQNRSQKPELVLLDEVHTYEGVHGAQVALLLRRWRQAVGHCPHFVGLSATLRDARKFFATLVSLPEYTINEIMPLPEDLVKKGMEYLVALRGDPVSGASLLSTTIQTAMLMRRVLDPS